MLSQKGAPRCRVGREDAFDAKGRRIDVKAEVPREAAREGVGDALRSAAGKLTGRIKTIDEARRLPHPERAYEAVKRSNPYYRKRPGYEDNCQRCVIAYEARRRGCDVIALPSAAKPDRLMSDLSPTGWPKMFKSPKLEAVRGTSKQEVRGKIEGKMDSFGDGSRAIVGIGYEGMKDGHVFIAENAGGRIRFLDPQNGNRDCSHLFQMADLDNTVILRIDNLEFSDLVGRAVRRP
ncbi:MAG: toxin glutamine deamidase domain-containing protein [Collinsella sp.]|nr:toxin glutamine deamidase domain-containing protein [Collinsella sp.]